MNARVRPIALRATSQARTIDGPRVPIFLALWKDADPDIPILIEARNDCAVLN
jgi:hypothetical protein